MKRFEAPFMNIQRLDPEDIMRASIDCKTEALNCVSCYCAGVTCEGVWSCDGFMCTPRYDEL